MYPVQGPLVLGHTPRHYHAFFWHQSGMDGNGNGGPDLDGPGWHVVAAKTDDIMDFDAALFNCPASFQTRVKIIINHDRMEQKCGQCEDPGCRSLLHYMVDTCGWGVGFSFMGEVDWFNELNNLSVSAEMKP